MEHWTVKYDKHLGGWVITFPGPMNVRDDYISVGTQIKVWKTKKGAINYASKYDNDFKVID